MIKKKIKINEEESAIEKKLEVADSALTKFGLILKKHWGKLLLIIVSYLIYQFFSYAFSLPADIPAPHEPSIEVPVDHYKHDTIPPDSTFTNN